MKLDMDVRLTEMSFLEKFGDDDVDKLSLEFRSAVGRELKMNYEVPYEEAKQSQIFPGQMFRLTLERREEP